MPSEELNLTPEQEQLLYLLSVLTNSQECDTSWVKETPLHALIFYGIQKGVFNSYDYAPISSSFLGKGRKFLNISKEGEDDLGDLREMGLLETIRLSSSRHDFITGFRPTEVANKYLKSLSKKNRKRIDELFICSSCKGRKNLKINVDKPEFKMVCDNCSEEELIPLDSPEDVSYVSRPYFFEVLKREPYQEEEDKK